MSDFPRLAQMGIKNPHEIEKFGSYTSGTNDVLTIVYDRKKGSLLPVSRRYKFPKVMKSVIVDSGSRQTENVYESSSEFQEALNELETLMSQQQSSADVKALINEELRLLQEDVAWRSKYIASLLEKI